VKNPYDAVYKEIKSNEYLKISYCFREIKPPAVDYSTGNTTYENGNQTEDEVVYDNIIPLRVNHEPVYLELSFVNNEAIRSTRQEQSDEAVYANLPAIRNSEMKPSTCDESEIIYSAIRPTINQTNK
jgi:hypothetical protein